MVGEAKAPTLVSVPQFARMRKMSRSWAFRVLLRMHARDREEGVADWLVVHGPHRKLKINLERLQRVHPSLFAVRSTTKEDIEELRGRLHALEENAKTEKQRVGAALSGIRELRAGMKRLLAVADGSGSRS